MIILIIAVSTILFTYILIVVNLYRGLLKIPALKTDSSSHEYISVVISAHNESENLPGLMSTLARQDYPKNLHEVIIVNDRSTDQTSNVLQEYTASVHNLKTIHIGEIQADFSPKKYAIDRAISNARGSLILLTDADGRPGPGWIRAMGSYFSGKTGLVIGYAPYSVDPPYDRLIFKILALEYMSHACIAAATAGLGFPITCVGTNLAYYKSVYLDMGGFGQYRSYHSGDDDLFMQRVRDESNSRISYAFSAAAHVYNAPPSSWNQFFNQRLRYASKGFFYPLFVTAGLIVYYLFNLLLLILAVLALFQFSFILIFSSIFVIKIISEFFLLRKFASMAGQKNLLKYFLPTAVLHIPYIVFFGFLGSVMKYKWAGREK